MDGKKLKKLRDEKGISLGKLSEMTGISKSYISLLEREIQTNPGLDILEKLAETFDVEVEELVRKDSGFSTLISSGKAHVKSTLKVEIELSEDQLTPEKFKQIKKLIDALNTE
ncbi:helix-turn-helix transcriptional regulator [Neobacillus sp. FSL H8-0543]|uniref:helix-turn-helix domain-containing protein n=1 Tax=Neobacillus sp. FSL H8-0543 TaxID=2954672 RepID=UPI003158CCB5